MNPNQQPQTHDHTNQNNSNSTSTQTECVMSWMIKKRGCEDTKANINQTKTNNNHVIEGLTGLSY